MKDKNKTKGHPSREREQLRQRNAKLKELEARCNLLERRLQDSEWRLRAIVDGATDIIIVQDLEGKYLYYNAASAYGLKESDVLGKTPFDFFEPTTAERMIEQINQVATSGHSMSFGNMMNWDGQDLWFMDYVSPVRDDAGCITSIITISRNITNLKQLEIELRESEDRFRGIVERSFDTIATLSLEGQISYVSPSIERISGYKPEEMIGQHFGRYFTESSLAMAAEGFDVVVRGGEIQNLVLKAIGKDGSTGWIEVNGSPVFVSGEVSSIQVILRNITERKEAEDALRESEAMYATLFEHSPVPLWEEDWTDLKKYIDNLRDSGVENFREYFNNHPEDIARCVSLARLVKLNQAASVIEYPDDARDQAVSDWDNIFSRETVEIFKDVFTDIAEGKTTVERELTHGLLEGGEVHRVYKMSVAPGCEETLRRVFISTTDITERRRIQEALRESEQKYRMLAESTPDSILVLNREGRFIYMNQAAADYLGQPRDRIIGSVPADWFPEEYASQMVKYVEDIYEVGSAIHFEYAFPLDEDISHFSVTLSPILDNEGNVVSVMSVSHDITELKRAEEALRESEEKWHSLVANTPSIVMIVNPDGIIQYINRPVRGMQPEDTIGKDMYDYIFPDYRDLVRKFTQRVCDTGESGSYQIRGAGPDNNNSWYEIQVGPLRLDGRVVATTHIVTDITERKRAEEALRNANERLDAFIESSPDSFSLYDAGLNLVGINQAAMDMLPSEIKKEDIMGKNLAELTPDFEETDGYNTLMGVLRTGTPLFIDNVVTHPRFGERILSVKIFKAGNDLGIITADITGRRRAEEALEKRNKELTTLNAIAQSLSQSVKLNDVLKTALDSVLEVMDMPFGVVYLQDEGTGGLAVVEHRGLSEEMLQFIQLTPVMPEGMAFSGKVAKEGKVIVTNNLLEKIEPPYRSVVEYEKAQSAAGIPLKSKGKTLGSMVICSYDRREFSPEEIRLLETIGNQIGVAIENAQLFEKVSEQSLTDELTGLYNRRHFYKILETEISRSQRFSHPFSVVMLDLDWFKEYNDKLGHINGDAALKSLAQTLKSALRKTDVAFRHGGDEFAIILPQTDAERAGRIVERIRKKWSQTPKSEYTILENPLSFSAGVAQFPENAETADGLVFLADSALYHSKRLGGNRSTLASEMGGISTGILATTILDQVYALSATVDARDPYTYGHSKRVAAISDKIGKSLGLSGDELANLHAASLLHDIGKVGMPDSILSKPGELTKSEWRLMKRHAVEGAKIVGHVNDLSEVLPAVLHHHEWYNGNGYPDGLKGEDIPIAARIISVADAYDTMTTPRPYKEVMSHEEACEELRSCSGSQFDPDVVEALIKETDSLSEQVSV